MTDDNFHSKKVLTAGPRFSHMNEHDEHLP